MFSQRIFNFFFSGNKVKADEPVVPRVVLLVIFANICFCPFFRDLPLITMTFQRWYRMALWGCLPILLVLLDAAIWFYELLWAQTLTWYLFATGSCPLKTFCNQRPRRPCWWRLRQRIHLIPEFCVSTVTKSPVFWHRSFNFLVQPFSTEAVGEAT